MSISLPIEHPVSSLGELLQEFGISTSDMCRVSLKRGADLLKGHIQESPPNEPCVPLADGYSLHEHKSLLQCIDELLILLPQVDDNCLLQLTKDVVCDVVHPYLQIVATSQDGVNLTPSFRTLGSIISLMLRNGNIVTTIGPLILERFQNLLDEFLRGHTYSTGAPSLVKPNIVITLLAHVLRRADPTEIEKNGLSLSPLFGRVLCLLKQADLQTCYLVSSSLLPLLITVQTSHTRARQVWGFIADVHLRVICVNSQDFDLILALLCCLSDVFVFPSKCSPFLSLCQPTLLAACGGPVLDLRVEVQFWQIVQEGLVSGDTFARKRAMYLLHLVLDSVRDGGVEEVASAENLFWWSSEYRQELVTVWNDLVLVLETMEEKQV